MVTKQELLKFFKEEADRPVMDVDVAKFLKVEGADVGALVGLMDELVKEGSLIMTKKRKFAVPEHFGLVNGKLMMTTKGYGFVSVTGKREDDVFIPPSSLGGAMHQDKVLIKVVESTLDPQKKEGTVVQVVERANWNIVGTFTGQADYGFVVPDDKKINKDIYIPASGLIGAQTGQKVVATITKWPEELRNPEGNITEILGFKGDPGTDILSIIRQYQLPEEFPKKVLREAEDIPVEIAPEDLVGRKDLRQKRIVTIDGADAKDLDDAISLEKLPNGHYWLGVHIADVTHYVKEKSKLDQEAFERGTSVYLIDRVIPMLPPRLSNGICSLNPHVDRLTLSVFMEITSQGVVTNHEIAETVINTTERLVYTDVSDILEGVEREGLERLEYMREDFKLYEELALILKKHRDQRGSIDFDFPEPYITLDASGKPVDVFERERRVANRIIEEFMLVTNETVAETFNNRELPFVYRVHETPDPTRIENFQKFIWNFGYSLKGVTNEIHPKSMQALLKEIVGKPEEHIVNRLMLRSLKQARYSPECLGHFGLAAEYYCHYTSPIRRYPDLQIHRIIKDMLHKRLTPERIAQLTGIVELASENSSDRERNAEQAEREVDDLKKTEYMVRFVGEEFTGIISSVTSFGLFIELENTIEGLCRMSDLDDDYYLYDEQNLQLIGERKKKVYRIGDRVKIRVDRANVEMREVGFVILESLEINPQARGDGLKGIVRKATVSRDSVRGASQGSRPAKASGAGTAGKSRSGKSASQGKGRGGAPAGGFAGKKAGEPGKGKAPRRKKR